MAKKSKKKANKMAKRAEKMILPVNPSDGMWDMFTQTGNLGYYLLYKSLNGDDDV